MQLPEGWTIEDIGCGWLIRDPDGKKFKVEDTKEDAIKAATEEAELR